MKSTKKWLVIALVLVLVGIIIVAISAGASDLNQLFNRRNYTINTHDISNEFTDISIDVGISDVEFIVATDGKCKVVSYDTERFVHNVVVNNGVLTVSVTKADGWQGIVFGGNNLKVTLYLPLTQYRVLDVQGSTGDIDIPGGLTFDDITLSLSTGDINCSAKVNNLLKISASTGDVEVENCSVGALDISLTTGEIELSDVTVQGDISAKVTTGKVDVERVTCSNLTSDGSTGDIVLTRVVATGKISITRGTGDIRFVSSDGGEVYAKTSTGDIQGTLLTGKNFDATSDTGNIRVPQSIAGGSCKLITKTGDIKISIAE